MGAGDQLQCRMSEEEDNPATSICLQQLDPRAVRIQRRRLLALVFIAMRPPAQCAGRIQSRVDRLLKLRQRVGLDIDREETVVPSQVLDQLPNCSSAFRYGLNLPGCDI